MMNAKDWRKGLDDWLWLGVGLAVLLASRKGMALRPFDKLRDRRLRDRRLRERGGGSS